MNLMATAAINWAYKQHGLTPNQKFVLVTLADRASASEWSCYPSIRDLSERTGLHRTSVMRALQALEDQNLVVRDARMRDQGGYTSSTFTLNRPDESALNDVAPCDNAMSHTATTLVAQCDHPSSTVLHRPILEGTIIEPSINHSKRVTEKMCATIYDIYPRKKGRGAALKAIRKAIKHFGFDALKDAVTTFAAEWQTKLANGEDMKFCPWPQRYFNEQRYMDAPDTPPQKPVNGQAAQPGKPMSVWELRTLRDTLQEDARQIRLRYCAEEAHYTSWDSEDKRAQYNDLIKQVKALNKQLKAMAGGDEIPLERNVPPSVESLVASVSSKAKGGPDAR